MTKLVCFDLDDTLIQGVHSVMLLCMLNGAYHPLLEIESLESSGSLDWIQADHQKAAWVKGLPIHHLGDGFDRIMKPLSNISSTVAALQQRGIQSIVITAGPKQVANVARCKWGFDTSYGSDYEVVDNVFTGKITQHIGDKGKVFCLREHCRGNEILPDECMAVGDGFTYIPLFAYCGKSVAINASAAAAQKATYSIHTGDLADILQFV